MAEPTGHAGRGTAQVDYQVGRPGRRIAETAGVCVMAIDKRLERQWRATRARRQMLRDVVKLRHTYGRRDGETEASFQARLARQDDAYARTMDLREQAANEDDEPVFE